MDDKLKFRGALFGIIAVSLLIACSVIVVLQYYVGFAIIPGEAGKITTVNIVDERQATYWHGFFGVAIMVQQFDYQQKYRVDEYGIDIYNLLFPCMEYGESHEVYATNTLDVEWATVEPAEPEFIDTLFGIEPLQSAVRAFTDNISVEFGTRNITGIHGLHTYVNSSNQSLLFEEGLLKDGLGNPIIVTKVEDFTPGYTGDVINYQMMVPVNPFNDTTLYFFTDPNDYCPEGWGDLTPPGNVTGVVTDKATGTPLQFTRIIIAGGMTTTNENGTYLMQAPGGDWKVVALKVGYYNAVENVTVIPTKQVVKDIQLTKIAEQQQAQTSSGSGSGKGPGKDVGPGIGPYLEKPKKREGIDHFITTKGIDRTLRMGQFFEDEIFIFNYGNKTAELDINVTGNASEVVEIDKAKLFIKPDSHESFKVTTFGRGIPGNFNGSITLTGTFDEKIPLKLFLTTKEKLPIEALLLDVIPITETVYRGGQLKFKVDLRNLLSDLEYNVSLSYYLLNPKENLTTFLGSDFRPVKTSISLIKGFTVPENLPLGDEILNVKAEYMNVTTEANTVIVIDEPFYNKKLFGKIPVWWTFVFTGLLAVLGVLLWYVRKRIEEKRRYHLKVAYKTLPQKGSGNVFIGKIAETNKPTYFELNKLTTHAIVAGSTGGGKTISAQVLVEECLKNNIAIVVFDPTAQWSGFLRKCDSETLLKLYPEFGMKKEDARSFNGNVRQIQDAREKINLKKFFKPGELQVFTIDKLDPKDIDIFVTNTVREVFHEHFDEAPELKYLMVYDEVHRLLPRFGGSGEGFIQIERACREFRKWGIGVLLVSQVLTDFASQIKANINSEIQMRTRDEGDLKRIATKYGKEVLRSLVKATVGTGMLENPAWNFGKPYFVSWRPILHSVHRLTDDELSKYNKYNEIIDDIEFQISQLKKLGDDVFDLELELKLSLDKVKSGNFNMVDIYLEGLKPEVDKRWKKLGKKPEHRKIELVNLEEIQIAVEQARKEREKYLKEAEKTQTEEVKKAPTRQSRFELTLSPDKALNFDNGQTVLNATELIDVLDSMDDETYARHVNKEKNDIAQWLRSNLRFPELGDKMVGKSRTEAIEILKVGKIDEDKAVKSDKPLAESEPVRETRAPREERVAEPVKAALPKSEETFKRETKIEEAHEGKPQEEKVEKKTEKKPDVHEPFKLANGQQLKTLDELAGAMKFMDNEMYSKHVSDGKNDFAKWIEDSMCNKRLAEKLRGAASRSEMIMLLEEAA